MTPLAMIAEWRRGCADAHPAMGKRPEECELCTRLLIEALERSLTERAEAETDRASDDPRNSQLSTPECEFLRGADQILRFDGSHEVKE